MKGVFFFFVYNKTNEIRSAWLSYTQLSVSVTVTHWDFVWHLHISNTSGLCRMLRHRLPTSSQQFINEPPAVREIVIGQLCLNAHLPIRCQHMGICARSARHTNLRVSMSVPLSILYLLIINLMEFLKVWAKHNFYYIRYISVYIQPRYFYLIFRSVNCNNMNRVILHSVRPSFWKKRAFSHAPRCGSTESGCEISVPWWLILADLGKMTSVWSRDRDTGDTSED